MPQTTLYDRTGKSVGSVELSDELFAAPVNAAVLHQVVTAQLAGRRTGTHDTKTRGEVRGGGKKPYRQKGTGRARQGTVSAPALPRRRRRLRPAPALVRAAAAAQDEAARPARRAHREVRRRGHQGHRHVRARGDQDARTSPASSARSRRPAGSSSSRRRATRSSSCRRATCRRSRSSSPTRSTSSTCSRPTSSSSSSRRSRGWQEVLRMSALTAPGDHPAPRHQREVDRRVRPRQVHLRRPPRRQQDPDQGGVEELYKKEKVTVVVGQRPHDEGQGEAPRHAARPDRRPHHALAQGHRHPGPRPEDRILRGGLTMPLRSYKATSPGLRQMTRSTFEEITTKEPHKPLLEPQNRGSGRNNAGPAHGPPSRRRREAALPQDRLQARQARRARPARDDRVRPEPLRADRPAPLPRRREALHAPARTA